MAVSTPISSHPPGGEAVEPCSSAAVSAADSDLWIFRDGKTSVSGPAMLRELIARLEKPRREMLVDCVIQAGQLECGVADRDDPATARCSELTDALAMALVSGQTASDSQQIAQRIQVPDTISIAPPEGFTYYALHPLDFAHVMLRMPPEPAACALVGIRSIGTTLSAVAMAALKQLGRPAERITVRPTGHPYGRNASFSFSQLEWIRRQLSVSARFLLLDEGPGRSGSTFLAVAEELVRAGVAANAISVIGTRSFDPAELYSENSLARWQHFHFLPTTPSGNSRFAGCIHAGGGEWRSLLFPSPDCWPETWAQMERAKYLSPDRNRLFKFEGMGPMGMRIRERAFALADAGFSPVATDIGDGFLAYDVVEGRPARAEDLSAPMLDQFAKYLAFRCSEFAAPQCHGSELKLMLEHNLRQEFGNADSIPNVDALVPEAPVITDGCMQPYEWVVTSGGRLLKTDGISHGDNHFFPGPCNIAWDLAGAAVEWGMGNDAIEFLLAKFHSYTGRNPQRDIAVYMLAYTVFRLGFCKMAASTVPGTVEEARCRSAYLRYRAQARKLLQRETVST